MRLKTEYGDVELKTVLNGDKLMFEACAGMKRHIEEFPFLRVESVPYRVTLSGFITQSGVVVIDYLALRRGGSHDSASTTSRDYVKQAVGEAVGEWIKTDAGQEAWIEPKEESDGCSEEVGSGSG